MLDREHLLLDRVLVQSIRTKEQALGFSGDSASFLTLSSGILNPPLRCLGFNFVAEREISHDGKKAALGFAAHGGCSCPDAVATQQGW